MGPPHVVLFAIYFVLHFLGADENICFIYWFFRLVIRGIQEEASKHLGVREKSTKFLLRYDILLM